MAKTSSGDPVSPGGIPDAAAVSARADGTSVTFSVWVVPGARRTELDGQRDGYLRVRLASPAREGRANDELLRFLAGRTGVGRADVELVAGQRGRRKVVRLRGVSLSQALARLVS